MNMRRGVLLILLAGIFLSGCEKEECGCENIPPVLFEYHYINYAWGFQENGWLIDGDGNVQRYSMHLRDASLKSSINNSE